MHEKEGLAGMSSKRCWSFGRWEIFSASIINVTPHRRTAENNNFTAIFMLPSRRAR